MRPTETECVDWIDLLPVRKGKNIRVKFCDNLNDSWTRRKSVAVWSHVKFHITLDRVLCSLASSSGVWCCRAVSVMP